MLEYVAWVPDSCTYIFIFLETLLQLVLVLTYEQTRRSSLYLSQTT